MKTSSLLLLLILFISSIKLLASDKEFTPGYIILENGDTIQGAFKNNLWRINPYKVTFTSHLHNGDTLEYGIKELKGFATSDYRFLKEKIKIDESPNTIDQAGVIPIAKFREDTVFLEVLIKGNASLFLLKEKNGRDHYFIETPYMDLQELLNIMYAQRIETNTGIVKNYVAYSNDYKSQLTNALIGCSELNTKDYDIDLNQKDLHSLIIKYNDCISTESYYSQAIEKWGVHPYLNAGLNFATTSFVSSNEYYSDLVKLNFTTSVSFTVNFGLHYVIPKYNKRLKIFTDLGFNKYSFIEESSKSGSTQNEKGIKYSQITVNFGTIYNLSKSINSPFLKIGVSTIFGMNMENDFLSYSRRHQWGLTLGAGVNFSNLSILYQFQMATGISFYPDMKNKLSSQYIMLGYTFIKNKK